MRILFKRFRKFFLNAALFSFFINLALLAPSLYMLQIFDRVLSSRSDETLLMLTLITAATLLMMLSLDYLRTLLMLQASIVLDRNLGERTILSLIEKGSQITNSNEANNLRDVANLRNFLTGSSFIALLDLPWMLFYVVLIYLFHPLLGVIATLGGLTLFCIAWSNEYLNRTAIAEIQKKTRQASYFIDQGIASADAINAMGMAPDFAAKWKSINEILLQNNQATGQRMGAINSISRFTRQILQIITMAAGAYLVIDQHMSAGIMIATTIILGRALAPIENMIGNWGAFIKARQALERLEPLLSMDVQPPRIALPAPKGQLAVENIFLAGKTPDRPIIRNASFKLEAGQSLAVIGPSASGKTSLSKLLVGIWQPTSGFVRLDGSDIGRIDRTQFGQHIGYLPQNVELLPGTIAENIARFSTPDPTAIVEAAQRAFVHDLILKLPHGYDTLIGSGGHILSGGQMQRIGLARALYRKPKLVVLDEPNSNLDAEGETHLLNSLKLLRADGITTIVVTHKAGLLQLMDKIIVLRDGRMELFGAAEDILERLKANSTPQP